MCGLFSWHDGAFYFAASAFCNSCHARPLGPRLNQVPQFQCKMLFDNKLRCTFRTSPRFWHATCITINICLEDLNMANPNRGWNRREAQHIARVCERSEPEQ